MTSAAAPGDVLSSIHAVSHAPVDLRITLPWKDLEQTANGGQHPWRVDDQYRSTLTLFNNDRTDVAAPVIALYADGKAWIKRLTIAPLSVQEISINEIVSKQLIDHKGRTLPSAARAGLVDWYTLGVPNVFGTLVEADAASRVLRPYACYQTTITCGALVPSVLAAVGQDAAEVTAEPETCIGAAGKCGTSACSTPGSCSEGGGNFSTYQWSISNTTIATLESPSDAEYATVKGSAAGTTNLRVAGTDANKCTVSGLGVITVKASCPVLTNFTQTFSSKGSDGTLFWNYTWSSSTGKLSDLSDCSIGESVYYPGSSNPYTWPAPMTASTPNPSVISGSATGGGLYDRNLPPSSYSTPYVASSFNATQRFWWSCSCYDAGQLQYPLPDITITRSVINNNGTWQYQITKAGQTNTVALP